MLWLIQFLLCLSKSLILIIALGGHVQVRLTVIWLVALIFSSDWEIIFLKV